MKNVSAELIIKSPFDMTKLKSREMVVKPLLNLRAILNHPVMEKTPFPTLIKIKPTVPSTLASFVPDPNYVEPFSRLSEAVNQKLDTYAPEVHNKGEKIIAKTGERTLFKQYRFFLTIRQRGNARKHFAFDKFQRCPAARGDVGDLLVDAVLDGGRGRVAAPDDGDGALSHHMRTHHDAARRTARRGPPRRDLGWPRPPRPRCSRRHLPRPPRRRRRGVGAAIGPCALSARGG